MEPTMSMPWGKPGKGDDGNGEAAARASDKLMDYVESFTRATVSM